MAWGQVQRVRARSKVGIWSKVCLREGRSKVWGFRSMVWGSGPWSGEESGQFHG